MLAEGSKVSQYVCWNSAQEAMLTRICFDQCNAQKICNEAMRIRLDLFFLVSYYFKTQEMCIRTVEKNPWDLGYFSDCLKIPEIYVMASIRRLLFGENCY